MRKKHRQQVVRKTSSASKSKKIYMTFATFNALTTKSFVNSIVVLNCVADVHVCNQIMKHKYTKKTQIETIEFLQKIKT